MLKPQRLVTAHPAIPTMKGDGPTPLKTLALVLSPTAAIAVPKQAVRPCFRGSQCTVSTHPCPVHHRLPCRCQALRPPRSARRPYLRSPPQTVAQTSSGPATRSGWTTGRAHLAVPDEHSMVVLCVLPLLTVLSASRMLHSSHHAWLPPVLSSSCMAPTCTVIIMHGSHFTATHPACLKGVLLRHPTCVAHMHICEPCDRSMVSHIPEDILPHTECSCAHYKVHPACIDGEGPSGPHPSPQPTQHGVPGMTAARHRLRVSLVMAATWQYMVIALTPSRKGTLGPEREQRKSSRGEVMSVCRGVCRGAEGVSLHLQGDLIPIHHLVSEG